MQPECTKRCTKCGADKPLAEFHLCPRTPDGKTARCKLCASEDNREQREKHRERRLVEKRAEYQANKAAYSERAREYRRSHADEIREQKRRWREENRELYRAMHTRWNRRLRVRVLRHYSNGALCCACCGEHREQFLALDHVNGDGAAHRRALGMDAGQPTYRWAAQNDFPPIFRVLCHNCNSAIGFYGACPHDAER